MRRLVDTLIALVVLAPPFYFWFGYAGPFQWLAELQLRWWNSYTEQLTFLGAMLLWMAFCAILGLVFKPFLARAGYELNIGEQGPDNALNRGAVALFIAGPLIGCAAGGYQWLAGASMKGPVPVTPAALAVAAPSRYVAVRDYVPLVDNVRSMTESRNSSSGSAKLYVPLAPRGWKPGQPVVAYVELRESEMEEFARAREVEGVVKLTGLPGMMRTAFERDGLVTGGKQMLIDFHGTPRDEVFSGQLIIGISAVIGVVLLFRAWRDGRFQ